MLYHKEFRFDFKLYLFLISTFTELLSYPLLLLLLLNRLKAVTDNFGLYSSIILCFRTLFIITIYQMSKVLKFFVIIVEFLVTAIELLLASYSMTFHCNLSLNFFFLHVFYSPFMVYINSICRWHYLCINMIIQQYNKCFKLC